MKIRNTYSCLAMAFFVLFSACASTSASKVHSKDVSSEYYEGFKQSKIDEILVLPVLIRAKEHGVLVNPESVLGIPDSNSTKLLVSILSANTDFDITELSEEKAQTYISRNGVSKEGMFKVASEVSKNDGAQNVLFTIIDDKDNRTGGALGSDRASSIGYRMWLYNRSQDKVVWSSAFQSNQSALTENLFDVGERIQNGIAFKTSETLLRDGFKASAQRLKKEVQKADK